MSKPHFAFLLFCLFYLQPIVAQDKKAGPVIMDFGEVFEVPDPDFKIDVNVEYKAVFDIMDSPGEYDKINPAIETAARYLNLHAQNGIPVKQLKFALVVHGNASKDIISNETYKKRYGTNNPNQELIKALLAAGGKIIFCGQSSASRGFPKEDLIEGVQLSLSAMTALIQLQNEEYRLIKF